MVIVITQEDLDSVKYFIEEKGDITHWVGWQEKKNAIFSKYPHLRAALHNLEMAKKTLSYVVEGVCNGEFD